MIKSDVSICIYESEIGALPLKSDIVPAANCIVNVVKVEELLASPFQTLWLCK